MKKLLVATLMAGSLSLGACANTYEDQQTLEGAGW
jgi:predicted small secreted protein